MLDHTQAFLKIKEAIAVILSIESPSRSDEIRYDRQMLP